MPLLRQAIRKSRGVRFHVKLEHPDKLEEFNERYYPEMSERFKQSIASD